MASTGNQHCTSVSAHFRALLYVKYSDLHVQPELNNCLRDDLAFE